MSGGPDSPDRHHSNKHKGESPGEMPVDCMGRPAVMSTMEPNVSSLVRETRKMTYSREEKAAQLHAAAGFETHRFAGCDWMDRGKKKITLHDSMSEVAFRRNADGAPKISGTAVGLEEAYKDCGGISTAEWHRTFDCKRGKQCVSEWCQSGKKCIQQNAVVLNNTHDDSRYIDPKLRTMYENAAGFGKSAAVSKKVPKAATETQASTLRANASTLASTTSLKHIGLQQGHASTKQNENRAGVLSSDLWRP